MRLKLGLIVGFAIGYYFGARAGRERYVELNRMLKKVRRSDAFETAAEKAKAVVDLGVERAKDALDHQKVMGESGPVAVAGTGPVSKN